MKKIALIAAIAFFLLSCKKSQISRAVVFNNGVRGNTSKNLLARMNDVYKNNPGLVILMIGTNEINNFSLSQYSANLEAIISGLQVHHIQVILMSPPPTGTKVIEYPDSKNEAINAEAHAMDTLSQIHNCYYFDLHSAFIVQGSPNATVTSLIRNQANNPAEPDGTHPDQAGYDFIAEQVFKFIKANNLTAYLKISCFGDSITAGTTNQPYPLTLQQLLNK